MPSNEVILGLIGLATIIFQGWQARRMLELTKTVNKVEKQTNSLTATAIAQGKNVGREEGRLEERTRSDERVAEAEIRSDERAAIAVEAEVARAAVQAEQTQTDLAAAESRVPPTDVK